MPYCPRLKPRMFARLSAEERERHILYLADLLAVTLAAREDDDTPAERYLPPSRGVH